MATKRRIVRSSGNVFEDLGFGPDAAEHLRIRSALMATLRQVIQDRGLTQAKAAALLGVTQPRISDLVRGKIDLFSIDTLVDMLARAGFQVKLRVAHSPSESLHADRFASASAFRKVGGDRNSKSHRGGSSRTRRRRYRLSERPRPASASPNHIA